MDAHFFEIFIDFSRKSLRKRCCRRTIQVIGKCELVDTDKTAIRDPSANASGSCEGASRSARTDDIYRYSMQANEAAELHGGNHFSTV